MINSLKAEVRKIYTVRSTYAILAFCFVIMCIFAFWVEGYKAGDGSRAVTDVHKLAFLIRDAVGNLAFFGGIVGILCFSSEYRYNTIMYTLASSNSRIRILLSKIITVSLYSIFFTLFVAVFASLLMFIGLSLKGLSLSHQELPADIIYKTFFTSWGYSMVGLLFASLIRNQVGAIATFFAVPAFIEPLAGLALKDNRIYLPFAALQQVTMASPELKHALSPAKATLVFSAYLVAGWIIAWYLFLKRDAN
jgi:ABC-type transport system involved in multi-copper enzyme maturation permease subunit